MAYGNWDEIVKELTDHYLHAPSPYDEHARGILGLIPRLRQEVALSDLIPITSHGTLVLEYPGIKTRINIWSEKAGEKFKIYLYDGNERGEIEDELSVSSDQIIPAIRRYAEKLLTLIGTVPDR